MIDAGIKALHEKEDSRLPAHGHTHIDLTEHYYLFHWLIVLIWDLTLLLSSVLEKTGQSGAPMGRGGGG